MADGVGTAGDTVRVLSRSVVFLSLAGLADGAAAGAAPLTLLACAVTVFAMVAGPPEVR